MSQRVECPICQKLYESFVRACPQCGAKNALCSARFKERTFIVDESVLIPLDDFLRKTKRDEVEIITEAIEEWLDRNRD